MTSQASSPGESCVGVGGFKGSVSVLDLNAERVKWKVPTAHSGIVNSIDGNSSTSAQLVSGSRDGTVKLWDIRIPDPVLTVESSRGKVDCWSVCYGNVFDNHDSVVVAGYDNGDLRLIDLRTNTVRWEKTLKNGVCHVSFDRKDIPMNKLAAACLNGELAVFDMRTFNEESGFAGLANNICKSTLWGCHFLPQDREIMAVNSGNGEVALLRYSYPPHRSVKDSHEKSIGVAGSLECVGRSDFISSQPLTAFDWHSAKRGLFATVSFDQVLTVCICNL